MLLGPIKKAVLNLQTKNINYIKNIKHDFSTSNHHVRGMLYDVTIFVNKIFKQQFLK